MLSHKFWKTSCPLCPELLHLLFPPPRSSKPAKTTPAGLGPFGPRSAPWTTESHNICQCLSHRPDSQLLQGKACVMLLCTDLQASTDTGAQHLSRE